MKEIVKSDIKKMLFEKLKEQNAFWSFDMSGQQDVSDETIILKTLIHLDIDDINLLYQRYSKRMIKKVWREQLVIQGDYYKSLNRLIAWLYFDIKDPDRYIKTITTKHINKLIACTV